MKKRLLITGYPGWLTSRLLETWSDYQSPFTEIRCLVHPSQIDVPCLTPGMEIVKGDLLNQESLMKACEGVDAVLHTAAVLHVQRVREFYEVNAEGTKDLLEAAYQAKVKKFVHISTNAAQGFCTDPDNPLDESKACRPISHYGRSKREAELAVRKYQSDGKLQTVILRPAMFYGPPVPARHLDIYSKVQKGIFPVFGHGNYLRSITHIDNLIQGVHLALDKEEAVGNTYYIADEVTPTLNQIIDTMAAAMGRKVKRMHLPAFLADMAYLLDELISLFGGYWMLPHIVGESTKHICCKIDKAKKELGYKPSVSLEQGYSEIMRHCFAEGKLRK